MGKIALETERWNMEPYAIYIQPQTRLTEMPAITEKQESDLHAYRLAASRY